LSVEHQATGLEGTSKRKMRSRAGKKAWNFEKRLEEGRRR